MSTWEDVSGRTKVLPYICLLAGEAPAPTLPEVRPPAGPAYGGQVVISSEGRNLVARERVRSLPAVEMTRGENRITLREG